jgi:hypothetical protein
VAGIVTLFYSLTMVSAIAMAALFLGGLAWQAWRLGLLGHRYQVQSIRYDGEGQWWLHHSQPVSASGPLSSFPAQLRADSRIWSFAVWLGWHTESGVRWVLLLRRNCHPQLWRQMQARLRMPLKPATEGANDGK